MRKAGLAILLVVLLVLPVAAEPSPEDLFRQFDLFGTWASDCGKPAMVDNVHVTVVLEDSGQIVEDHDVGPAGVINRYLIVSARRLSATGLAVDVVFQPGTELEQRQKLEWLVEDGTRRTMFNQPEDGPPVVKDGIALAVGIETPVLRKCR
jgi:hypothetical protein